MGRYATFSGTLQTASTANPKQILSVSDIELQVDFDEQCLMAGALETGVDTWFSVPMGVVTTAQLLDFRADQPVTVRLNDDGSGNGVVLEETTRMVLKGNITKLELQRQVAVVVNYSAHFME